MSRIISFAWTTPALLAGAKTVTRRDWDADYAARFRAGDEIQAWDRSPRAKGRHVADIVLTGAPYREAPENAPPEDWDREGFAWLAESPALRRYRHPDFDAAAVWVSWRDDPAPLWVVRFTVAAVHIPLHRWEPWWPAPAPATQGALL
jgi:hypothetical protein